jgi:hypothetical protein
MSEELTELEYLRMFYQYADFGPADGYVRLRINEYIELRSGKSIPSNYRDEEEDNE